MNPTHYHTGVSGRIRFVTLVKSNGTNWTSDGYKASSIDLHSISELVGKRVQFGQSIGTIKQPLSDNPVLIDGKYLGNGKYLKQNINENQFVGVFWETGMRPYWVPAHQLKIL